MTFGWYDFLLSFFTIFQLFWRLVPPKYTVKTMVFDGFSIFAVSMRGFKNHPKMSPKIIKNHEKIIKFWLFFWASIFTQFLLKFNSILAPFWLHLASILSQKSKYFSNDAPRTDFYRFLPILDLIWGGFWTQPPPNRLQYLKICNISNQKSINIFKTCLKFHYLFLLLFYNVWHLFTRFPWEKKRPRAATRRVTMRGVSPPAWLNKPRLATEPKLVTTLKRMGFAYSAEEPIHFDFLSDLTSSSFVF